MILSAIMIFAWIANLYMARRSIERREWGAGFSWGATALLCGLWLVLSSFLQ